MGEPYLKPHPWDAFGPPPKPGPSYADPTLVWSCKQVDGMDHDPAHTDRKECSAKLDDEIGELDDEIERLEEEVREKEGARFQCEKLQKLIEPAKLGARPTDWVEVVS